MKNALRDAYFAGLIDGEGYISMKSKGIGKSKRPAIEVKMTCEETIRALHKHFGVGNVRFVPSPPNHPTWKNQWKWYATSLAAEAAISRISPYLITKREAALFVLRST